MRRNLSILILVVVAGVARPQVGAGQSLGLAARGGTLGFGVDAGLGFGERVVLRGGAGVLPLEIDATIDGIDLTLELPRRWYNVGLDLYLNGVVRVGGGLLVKADPVTLSSTPDEPQDIGGASYTPEEIGTLTGRLSTADQAPYAWIGFGRHTRDGFGLTLDLGAAFLRSTRVGLDAEGGTLSGDAGFRDRLDAEARDFEEGLPRYLEIWPIVSLGVRVGVGR